MVTKNITRKIMRTSNKYKHTKTLLVKDWLMVHIIGYIMYSTVNTQQALIKKQVSKQVEITQPLRRSAISQHVLSSFVVGNKKRQRVPFPFFVLRK